MSQREGVQSELALPRRLTGLPETCCMSPRAAPSREDLPEPVGPTTTIKSPEFTAASRSVKLASADSSQVKSPCRCRAFSPTATTLELRMSSKTSQTNGIRDCCPAGVYAILLR